MNLVRDLGYKITWRVWDVSVSLPAFCMGVYVHTDTVHGVWHAHTDPYGQERYRDFSHTCWTKQLNSLRNCTLNPNIGERFSSLMLLSSFVFCCARVCVCVCVCFLCTFSPTDARAAIFLLSPAAATTGNGGDYVSSGRYCQLPGRWQHLHGGSSSLPSAVRLRCW